MGVGSGAVVMAEERAAVGWKEEAREAEVRAAAALAVVARAGVVSEEVVMGEERAAVGWEEAREAEVRVVAPWLMWRWARRWACLHAAINWSAAITPAGPARKPSGGCMCVWLASPLASAGLTAHTRMLKQIWAGAHAHALHVQP